MTNAVVSKPFVIQFAHSKIPGMFISLTCSYIKRFGYICRRCATQDADAEYCESHQTKTELNTISVHIAMLQMMVSTFAQSDQILKGL